MSESNEKKEKRAKLVKFGVFAVLVVAAFVVLVVKLVQLQIIDTDIYKQKAESGRTKTIVLRGKRGTITDADSVILAEDEYIYNVTFYKDASQASRNEYYLFSKSIADTVDIIEQNGGEMAIKFNIERDEETGEWVFNFGSGVSDSVLKKREDQWRSNNYLTSMTKYDTPDKCIDALKRRFRIFNTPEERDAFLAEEKEAHPDYSEAGTLVMDEDKMLKVMSVFCEMQMNVFNSQPIVIAKDVRYETVIEIETRSMQLSGMEIAVGTKRVYPKSNLAAQIIGYTGAIPSQAKWNTLRTQGYSYNDTIGRDGIEASMEEWLTQNSYAKQGSRVVERDQMSKIVRELSYTEPQDGNNVKLTLRVSYQTQAERAVASNVSSIRDKQESLMNDPNWLEDNKADIATRKWDKYPLELAEHGCMIVVDMQDRVLAMANYPTYDLNALVKGGSEAIEILTDERNLMLNYGIHARGTPGSIFKMVTGMAALSEKVLLPDETIDDQGYFMKYNSDKSTAPKCWISPGYRYKHQDQTIVQGLSNSCNYFFYELGSRLGEERLYRYSSLFGLTSKTGIDLPGEVRSVVGSQNTLYDPTKPMNEANQDTSMPIIVFNSIKSHLRSCGESFNIEYDDERLDACTKRLMDMAINSPEGEWTANMRTILMEELNMTKKMVYMRVIISPAYAYLNEIKWGGSQTIMTAIGQSVTMLTPVAVARYVCAVANGGKVYNVSLIDSITSPEGQILSQREPKLINELEYGDEFLPLIRKGMKGVVDESGTAAKYFSKFAYTDSIAAKTGTAQTTSIDLENNGWFVAFAPYENPEIAIAVFVPHGYSGAVTSTAARDFLTWYMSGLESRNTDYVLPAPNSLAP